MLAYIGIVGGLAAVTLGLFVTSQFYRARLSAAKTELTGAKSQMASMQNEEPDCLTDESAIYHDRALWFNDKVIYFQSEVDKYSVVYTCLSLPAYAASILTLTSFGLVLKDADKQKEKEDAR